MKKKILSIVLLITMVFLAVGCGTLEDEESSDKNDKKIYGYNESFEFDDLEITVGEDYKISIIDNEFSEDDGKSQVGLPLTVKNLSEETKGLNMFYYTIYSPEGVKTDTKMTLSDDDIMTAGDLRPGASYTKKVYFLYDGDGEYVIEFENFMEKIEVKIDIEK